MSSYRNRIQKVLIIDSIDSNMWSRWSKLSLHACAAMDCCGLLPRIPIATDFSQLLSSHHALIPLTPLAI